ncbi:MAG TPA: hypothetical protein VNS49_03165 [Streptomyces sp.]|nr:hypothetical protein [Streptomyces sp.]
MDMGKAPDEGRRVRPVWLPPEGEFAGVDAGVWWDAVAVDGDLGARTAAHLKASKRCCGPVACAGRGVVVPRWYFLIRRGAARSWSEPGTQALVEGCRIGLPGSPKSAAHAVWWEVAPRFRAVPPLTTPRRLRRAPAAARACAEALS